jgi:hypothetical protein
MIAEARRAIAFIAAKEIGEARGNSVYDYDVSKYVHFSGQVGERIQIYDHDAGAHVTGSKASIYHYRTGAYITLQINGNRFSGFDHGSGQHFNGTVRRSNVQLFDYDGSGFHHYLVS